MSPHLVLIRGLPGSGKSTMAKTFVGYAHIENDMFLIEDGIYVFSNERRQEAVRKCIAETRKQLLMGNDVVVSNCFLKHDSMKPYMAIAKEANAIVEAVIASGDYGSGTKIPDDVLKSMKEQFEP